MRAAGQGIGQRGFSMVELMVALVLGLLLVAAVLQTFVAAKRTYEFQEEFSRIQENGRFAMEFLKRDIRGADFWGCIRFADITNRLASGANPVDYGFGAAVDGADGGSAYVPTPTPLMMPDTLLLRTATGTGANVVSPFMPTTAANVKVETGFGFAQGDILLVSDCDKGDIFQVTSPVNNQVLVHNSGATTTPGNASSDFSKKYNDEAEVYKAHSYLYSIDTGAGGEPGLFRDGDELVEGVENLQILYGEDADNDGTIDYYVSRDEVGDMDDVLGIRVDIVVRSLRDNLTDAVQAISFAGQTWTPSDRRIRKVFTSNVALRNRLD